MAVVSVKLNAKKTPQAQYTLNTSTYTIDVSILVEYIVEFSTNNSNPTAAGPGCTDGTTTIPTPLASTYSGYTCSRVFPQQGPHPKVWVVQVEYKNLPPLTNSGKWNFGISVTPNVIQEDAWHDTTGVVVQNSSKENFSPTLKQDHFDDEIRISFNCDSTTIGGVVSAIDSCKNRYNSGTLSFTINGLSRSYPSGGILFKSGSYSTVLNGSPPYMWDVAYILQFRKAPDSYPAGVTAPASPWIDLVLDRGYYALDSSGHRILIEDEYGRPHGSPVNLDGGGHPLAAGANPVYLAFDFHGGASLSGLFSGFS